MTPYEAGILIESHLEKTSKSNITDEQWERLEAKRKKLESEGVEVI